MPDKKEQWKDIPGYGGWYQISTEGRLRSFRGYGGRRLEIPRPLSASIKKARHDQRMAGGHLDG